ncbi:MAG: efflux RND transporter periplasmic adaptor subunit [Gammaproteobacteria bacterium]|nr:efflux RND transporter periplasmic adaptor subunit [Gammaproteobacteria bacterium]
MSSTLLTLSVSVAAAEKRDAAMDPLDCVINPSVVADLGSGVPGILSKVQVDRSDFVKAGDVIAELESSVESAALDLARARAALTAEVDLRRVNAAFGQRQNKRTKDLFSRKAISTNDMDQRETESRLAQIQLRQARDNKDLAQLEMLRAQEILKRRTITSPIDGVVMDRFKVIGEYVEDQPVVRVAQIDPLHVEVIVPVEQLGTIRNGMYAEVWSDNVEGESWHAKVSRVDQVADVASGTFGVRLTMPNPDHNIPAGLRCRMQLVEKPVTPVEEATAEVLDSGSEEAVADASDEPVIEKPVAAKMPVEQRTATQLPAGVTPIRRAVKSAANKVEPKMDVTEARTVALTPKMTEESAVPKVAKSASVAAKPIERAESGDTKPAEPKMDIVKAPAPAEPSKAAEEAAVAVPAVAAVEVKEDVAVAVSDAAEVNEKTKDVEPVNALPECRLAGPYNDEVQATKKVVTLRRAGLYVDIKSVPSTESSSFMIATPVLPDREEAKALVARLKAAGITDYYVPRKRSAPLRVSLGIYNNKRIAERKIRELAKMGFTAELLPWKQKGSQYFLIVRGTRSEANGELLASLPVPDGNAESTQGFCNHLAGR